MYEAGNRVAGEGEVKIPSEIIDDAAEAAHRSLLRNRRGPVQRQQPHHFGKISPPAAADA
jgi:hypothetical protein